MEYTDSAVPPDPRTHLTSDTTKHVLRLQHRMLTEARAFLGGRGFVELLPPVIGPVTDPGGRGAKQVDIDYYGHRYKLMTSAILYKQASLLGFDKIFYVAPNVRLEPLETANTSRHLAEFHQLDVEVSGASRDDVLDLLQDLVAHVVRRVVDDAGDVLEALGRDSGAFADLLGGAFGRLRRTRPPSRPCASSGTRRAPTPRSTGRARRSCRRSTPGRSSSSTTPRARAGSTTGKARRSRGSCATST